MSCIQRQDDAGTIPPSLQPSLPISDDLPGDSSDRGFLFNLLADQQTLTAVEEFSRAHDTEGCGHRTRYSSLLPDVAPESGQQYAFEVDLDLCSGCKACVTACHSLNGLDESETWRDVGLLLGGTSAEPVMQHVTTACHHCLEPACMQACPVDAYEKDAVTGIVKHLDDQCFGCQYCTLACPYDVPKYNASKGIVRKCDMCSDRLATGETPACAQACPHDAIAIRVVDQQQVVEAAETDHFLPGAPDPQFTLPTTHFKTSRVFPRNTLPADYHAVNPQHPHWPLIVMLVLTQLSVGAFIVGQMLETMIEPLFMTFFRQLHATSALTFGVLALGASTMHLGRPQYAFRAVVGLRHSWLSREIVAFGAFAGAAAVYAAVCWLSSSHPVVPVLRWLVTATGLAGVLCSVMIYVVTGREFWNPGATLAKFCLTSVVLGTAAAWVSMLAFGLLMDSPIAQMLTTQVGLPMVRTLVLASAVKMLLELSLLRHLLHRRQSPLKRSARLIVGPLVGSMFARCACGLLGGVVMPLFLWNELTAAEPRSLFLFIAVAMTFCACLAGELLERYQFFAACVAPRMPQGYGP